MLFVILAALALLIYGVYRATRRWGWGALWLLAAGVSALNASGVVSERLWGPRYSWNFAHHGWDSLPSTLMSFCFYLAMALVFCNSAPPRTR
jgi:hypothetical protein